MLDDGIIRDNSVRRVAEEIYESISDEERKELDALKFIDVDIEQVEYIQTIAQGWAAPLTQFMNEMQLLEVIQMKTITDSNGK